MKCFPLDNTPYDAADMGAYLCTRTRGVFSADGNLAVTADGADMSVMVSPGLGWLKWSAYWGVCALQESSLTLTIDMADGVLSRIDAVVCRLDKINNRAEIVMKKGAYSSMQVVEPPIRNNNYDEIYLATIAVNAGITAITPELITDQRLNEAYCGLMRDGVTGIPTSALHTQAQALLDLLQSQIDGIEQGSEVMLKTLYDPDNDGVIDNAWSLTGGKIIGKDTDLNDYREVGNYVCYANVIAESLKNIPVGLNRAFTLKVCAPLGTGETRKQILKEYVTARQYERTYLPDNKSWTNWEAMDKVAQEMALSAQAAASAALPLSGGVLTGELSAPDYVVSRKDGGYYLNGGMSGGKKIDYRLHANDGAFWIHRYEDGKPAFAPMTITASGYCDINGCAENATQILAGSNYLKLRWEGTVGVLDVDNSRDLAWNKARYLTPDSTSNISAEWALSTTWAFCPRLDAVHPLGLAFRRWSGIYLTSSPSVTSDRREKHDIEALDAEKAAAFVAALKPAAYKYNDGTSGRTHWGLIAQDVEEAMERFGISNMEFAGLIKAERPGEEQGKADAGETETYSYSLRYEEFIAPLIALAQTQEKRLAEQEKQIATLKRRLNKLEEK